MNKQMIEKLKDPMQAQPFGLRSKEEQELQQKAGRENVLYFDGAKWATIGGGPGGFAKMHTYILKPGYEPEPEYGTIEIELKGQLLVAIGWTGLLDGPTPIHKLVSRPDFFAFVSDSGFVRLEEVATRIHERQRVFAKLRKEQIPQSRRTKGD